MISEAERIAKACRFYEQLLKVYPASFHHHYGKMLSLQFKDEYRNALASGKQSSILRFWWFIGLDFISSLLMETQEEVVSMVKKNFFVCCAIAAGLSVLLWLPGIYQWFFHYDKLDMWSQLLFYPLVIGFGALGLFGIAKVSNSPLIVKVLPLILLAFAVSTIPIPIQNPPYGWVGRPAFTYLYANEDRLIGFYLSAYLFLMGIIAIVALIKRKWLSGLCLLAINLVWVIPNVAYAISEDSPILEHTWNSEWYSLFLVSIYVIAWFAIAWWLKKENESTPVQGALEEA